MAIVAHTTRAPGPRNPSPLNPYRVHVFDNSMAPRFDAGDPVWIDPAVPVAVGDDVMAWQGDAPMIGRVIATNDGLALMQFNAPGIMPLAGMLRCHRVMRPNEAIAFLAAGGHC